MYYIINLCLWTQSNFFLFKESDDPSISDIRKQVHRENRQELINHSDVELVDQVPDDPEDDDDDDASLEENQDHPNDAVAFEGVSNQHSGSDNHSVGSDDDDDLMVKNDGNTARLETNLDDSEHISGKNCTKKSPHDSYPSLSVLPVPINLPFTTKDVLSTFEMNDGVEVTEDELPVELISISGKKKYFLQANDILVSKLLTVNKKLNKKLQDRKDFSFMTLRGDREEFVVYPTKSKMKDCNIPERFQILTKYNQYNWIVPKGKFFTFRFFFIDNIFNES